MRTKRRRREIGVVTTGRSDYGLLRPVIQSLLEERGVRTRIYVTGMHLSKTFGYTVREIERDGFDDLIVRLPILQGGDDAASVAASMSRATAQFATEFERRVPDMLVVLGDRFETLGAVASTLPFNIPVAHIHGGESTEGAVDEVIRHAISKMSHLHFVAAAPFAARLRQMGEEPWRVTVSGAPALDVLERFRPTPLGELERRLGVPISRRTLLVTYHPETLRASETQRDIDALLVALDRFSDGVIFTAPNADPHNSIVLRRITRFAAMASNRTIVTNLGQQDYFSVMHYAGAMVGNSSSGIIEAPSFRLPVVNIGERQRGRLRAANVVDVPAGAPVSIARGVEKALSQPFRSRLARLNNPYKRRRAGRTIARRLAAVPIDQRLLVKPFFSGSRRVG